jgi:hypothetical protein
MDASAQYVRTERANGRFMKTRFVSSPPNGGAALWIVLAIPVVLALGLALGVASFLQQSTDTRALRECLLGKQQLAWRDRIVVNAGPVTFGVARLVSRFLDLPQEARAGVASLRGAEVGVFRGGIVSPEDRSAAMAKADETMVKRGWSRVVAVQNGRESVMVYVRDKGLGANTLVCCAVVCNERELVIVRVKSEPEPLLKLAAAKIHSETRQQ